ncbi:amidohydrolase [Galbitalea soli]|uniref:Amidohydrolase n=1 Tax=Galbitalea soli TaxID=1268042 RepID=A0A7C9TRG8_9MICO|nr:amidohydrolase [Galbitalea soli]NEM91302.1 amidohydrolase [Galbitalea soli]NYJ29991.1 5-methylthioadenosine/S-adenosylhomocysteine deaminase [Galbitalea soli]
MEPDEKPETIILGATVLTHTEAAAPGYPALPADDTAARGTVHLLADHAIGIAGGVILWVRPTAEVSAAERDGAELIDGAGHVAIPGLMNSHTHSAMTMFRNSAEDVVTSTWFNDHIWPMEVNMTPRDVRLGAELAVGEMLLAGVTSFADHYFSMEEIAGVVERSGARALLAETYFSSQGDEGIERSAAFAEKWNGAAGGRITTAMGPHATYTVNDGDLERTAAHARRLGIRTHIHAAESPGQTTSSLAARGITPMEVLHRTGILETGAIIAHGAGIVEDDLRWLTPWADRVAVACCDKVYLKHAQSGITPVRLLHDAGITVGVGTDGPGSHNTLDVLESMRFLSLSEKDRHSDATWLTSAHALDLATRQSAALFGQGDRLGRLLPGYRADIVLIDTRGPHMQPMHDLAAALVLSVKSSDVSTVLVDGAVVVRDHRLTTLDLEPAIAELNERIPQLRDTSHGRRIQDYAP